MGPLDINAAHSMAAERSEFQAREAEIRRIEKSRAPQAQPQHRGFGARLSEFFHSFGGGHTAHPMAGRPALP